MFSFLINLLLVFVVAEAAAVGASTALLLLGNDDPLANDMWDSFTKKNQ